MKEYFKLLQWPTGIHSVIQALIHSVPELKYIHRMHQAMLSSVQKIKWMQVLNSLQNSACLIIVSYDIDIVDDASTLKRI